MVTVVLNLYGILVLYFWPFEVAVDGNCTVSTDKLAI